MRHANLSPHACTNSGTDSSNCSTYSKPDCCTNTNAYCEAHKSTDSLSDCSSNSPLPVL